MAKKKIVYFTIICPKCQALGYVKQNEDKILWFDCPVCQFSQSWHYVSSLKRAEV